ncbi:hypothetical protein FA13DRAFT_202640 [Coprinellus micaceus]|uniref:MYND-type domain-containing protein n=1 Tax=Coprinellus micaceus TaxID=71717 RepID=A0A4Y7SGL1_COPMI|nr:hypothetical protein FA13DRAFT_202640 [Coprinellus micaceus]
MCIDREICRETVEALEKIPMDKLERFSTGWYIDHWAPFVTGVFFCTNAWRRTDEEGVVALCDNPNHHAMSSQGLLEPFVDSKQCSGCRVFVYCSPQCQRDDWQGCHRHECALTHQYRIERDLSASWLPHMHRAFFLNALHRAVLNFEVGFTPETITKSTSDTNPVIEYSHGPCSELRAELELRQTKMSVLRIETGDGGPKAFLHTTDEFQRFAHAGVPLFGGPRYLRYIRELCDSVSLGDVVGSEPEDGSQLIERRIRLAIFEVARWAGKTCVTALNVHAKTESRATAGEEVEEMRRRLSWPAFRTCCFPDCPAHSNL